MNTAFTPSTEQQKILDALEQTDKSFFIAGKAGTGKSFLIRWFMEHTDKKAILLSYTGLAAANIGGQTINSFFQIMTKGIYDPQEQLAALEAKDSAYGLKKALNKLDVLVIDEISMVRSDLLHTIDIICRTYRENESPFGGLQCLFVGDPYQLPPVVESDEIRKALNQRYKGEFFFNTPDINKSLLAYELKTIFRQEDEIFRRVLNNVRVGKDLGPTLQYLNKRVGKPADMDGVVILTTTNDYVNNYNKHKLAEIDEPMFTYIGKIKGDFAKKDLPTEYVLQLKVGAQIMMLVNDPYGRWYNGSVGKIHELTEDSIHIDLNGNIYEIDEFMWTNNQDSYDEESDQFSQTVKGSFIQYPIKLAWAVTIHKSQGQTFESAFINIPRAFCSGQTYVALSRCKSLEKLWLASPIREKDVIISPQVKQFMANME